MFIPLVAVLCVYKFIYRNEHLFPMSDISSAVAFSMLSKFSALLKAVNGSRSSLKSNVTYITNHMVTDVTVYL